jgi:hypothetical protein
MTRKKKTTTLTISKNPDGDGVSIAGYEPTVEVFPTITDEPQLEFKQPFIEPIMEQPHLTYDVADAIAELPEAHIVPTDRWYGEEFLPKYIQVRAKLRRLANIT